MNEQLEAVNERLDAQAVQMLECYEELINQRTLLERCLDEGYLNMSKARSLLGCASLSRLQIPQDESGLGEARFRVHVSDDDDHFEFEHPTQLTQMNPPKWIGAFAPLSLKASQKAFARSLPLLVSIANLQARLGQLQRTYRTLAKEKLLLVEGTRQKEE